MEIEKQHQPPFSPCFFGGSFMLKAESFTSGFCLHHTNKLDKPDVCSCINLAPPLFWFCPIRGPVSASDGWRRPRRKGCREFESQPVCMDEDVAYQFYITGSDALRSLFSLKIWSDLFLLLNLLVIFVFLFTEWRSTKHEKNVFSFNFIYLNKSNLITKHPNSFHQPSTGFPVL